jgi:hypothetical protein
VVALVAKRRWDITHLDIKTAFLHGDLCKEVFMQQLEGFVAPRKEHIFYKVKKALYGLKHAARTWYWKINQFLKNLKFKRNKFDHMYFKIGFDGNMAIIILYVNDLLLVSDRKDEVELIKHKINGGV